MSARKLAMGARRLAIPVFVGLYLAGCSPLDLPLRAPRSVPPPWSGHETGVTRSFALTVARTRWEIAPDTTIEALTYNGQLPGPELRVDEGDRMRVTVTNSLDEPTTVHWHGLELPSDMDGVPDLPQRPIAPGASFTYEFIAYPAGTRWYHSHFDEVAQQGGGLVGALIVQPPKPAPADREYTIVTTQARLGGPPAMTGHAHGTSTGPPTFDAFLVNGIRGPAKTPLLVREGELVRLRLLNASATATETLALAGHRISITHLDGNPLARPVEAEAVRLGVGERADVQFRAINPGRWRLQALDPDQAAGGLAVDVAYAGHEADATRSPSATARAPSFDAFAGPARPARPDRTYDLTLSGGMMMMMGSSDSWTINGKSYPHTDPIEVRDGEVVRLRLLNMSMEDHPMHLHGHSFQVTSANGRSVDGPMKDTLTVHPMERYEIQFLADNAGVWLFHCHNLVHMEAGLMAEVRYR